MTDFILRLIGQAGYMGITILMFLENVFPPIPSEVIMGLGGMAVARGHMQMLPLIVWGTVGTVAGNFVWYEIGRQLGIERLHPFVDRWGRWLTLEWHDVEKLMRFFQRHGQWVVFVFRFMPAFRTIVSLPAGMARMPPLRFAIWTAAGSAIWNTILACAGYYLGANFHALDRYIGPAAVAITVVIGIGYVYRVLTWAPRG